MDCVMNGGVFLRANGDFVCWDDAGCNKVLQSYDRHVDYGADVFLGGVYGRIRDALKSNSMPHPSICEACLALNPTQPFSPASKEEKRIYYLQVESSFACQLRCTNCYPGVDRKTVLQRQAGGHLNLKFDAFSKILEDFHRSSISIDVVEFQGHGEPLINKSVWDMIRMTRALFPETHIRVITNGNFEFREDMATAGVSEMVFSIDGVDQESYEPYRVSGDFSQAYRFMRDFSSSVFRNRLPTQTSWKYILFEHSSSEAQLAKLHQLAHDAYIKDVHLVLTQMGPSSRRFFKALLDLRDRANDEPSAFEVLQAMQVPVSASWLSGEFKRCIGVSPFPAFLDQISCPVIRDFNSDTDLAACEALPVGGDKVFHGVDYRVSCYLSIQENLDQNLVSARVNLLAERPDDAGRSLVALATKLWRLYEGRYDMLTKSHSELIRKAIALVDRVGEAYRREMFLKLECFQASYSGHAGLLIKLFPLPVNEISSDQAPGKYTSTGNDPYFILFSENLSIPSGDVLLSYTAETIFGDLFNQKIYYDAGDGFCEQNCVLINNGRLDNCRVLVKLPAGTTRIRLDPADAPGRFTLNDVRLERIEPLLAH